MASKASRAASAPDCSALVQTLVLSLYDGGVLSPAVLERVIAAAGATAGTDWDAIAEARAKDQRSLAEIVVAVMLPGNPLDDVERDFAAVLNRLAGRDGNDATGAAASAKKQGATRATASRRADTRTGSADDSDGSASAADDALLAQLSRTAKAGRKRTSSQTTGNGKRGFNLSNNAVPPTRGK
jgi:hypothetical protein